MVKQVVFFRDRMKLSQTQQAFIRAHEKEVVHDLALRYSGEDMPFLLAQIAGRQKAEKKMPFWHHHPKLVYPVHLSLEQASSEVTARYKATLISPGGALLVDLTGGLGVDFSILAPHFERAVYVERDETLCRLAAHNFAELGLGHAEIRHMESEAFLPQLEQADLIYLDPARRDQEGRRVFRIEECSPDLSQLAGVLTGKAQRVMIKYSPMLDISLAVQTLGSVSEVQVVSVENECRELLFLLTKEAGEPLFHAVNLKRNGEREHLSFTWEEEGREAAYSLTPGRYLYEPNASILKAGAFNTVANRYAVEKLHSNSHLYTSDRLVCDFPGRIFTIDELLIPNRKNIRQFLSGTKKANIAVRNFPMSVAEIRKKTGLEEGGETYLFATTLADGRKVWIIGGKA